MTDDSTKQNPFNNLTPQPDINAKKRALNLAMVAFDEQAQIQENEKNTDKNIESNQGITGWRRLIGQIQSLKGEPMKMPQKKIVLSTLATSFVVLTGVIFVPSYMKESTRLSDYPDIGTPDHSNTNEHLPESEVRIEKFDAKTIAQSKKINPNVVEEQVKEIAGKVRQKQETFRDNAALSDGRDVSQIVFGEMDAVEEEVAVAAQSPRRLSEKSKLQMGNDLRKREQGRQAPSKRLATEAKQVKSSVRSLASADIEIVKTEQFRDRFDNFNENAVIKTREKSISTFSVDVDTASYSFVRRQLNQGYLPPKDAVRIEEMINYFDYQYPVPGSKEKPFESFVSVVDAPWKKGNELVHIGIQGYEIAGEKKPDSNLVFLLDVSGSMSSPDKLPLVKQSMSLLLDTLKPTDTVSIVVYAGAAGAVLEPTQVKEKQKILAALNRLNTGGSTAGARGIQLAYQLAEANYKKTAVNRIILATDGDFNVGHTQDITLKEFVERKREKGIYLSVLGFGQGNYQDAMMQTLAQSGNGIAAYIDTLSEAQKVLVHEATSSLFPIANDVKIQVEFNPALVSEYRLIGYETRKLKREDFNNDKVDAGDIGAGHSVTAIYEITPVNSNSTLIPESRYTKTASIVKEAQELGFVKIRYKNPGDKKSQLIEQAILPRHRHTLLPGKKPLEGKQAETAFATAVTGFAQLLRGSKYAGDFSYEDVIALASRAKGRDDFGYRTEFIQLVRKAKLAKALK